MKIIVCGDVKGKFSLLSKRLSSIVAKTGTCEMVFCVGEFFGDQASWQELEQCKITFPVQTYVLGACSKETAPYIREPSERTQLCPNLTYLGKSGLFTSHSKLKIFFLSGIESKEVGACHFGRGVLDSVRAISNGASFKGVDIFITSQWPHSVDKYANKIDQEYNGSKLISNMATLLKPRYHFCGLEDLNYERVPYRNHAVLMGKPQHITRFIALASFANPAKQKFVYAFNIEALEGMQSSELLKQSDDSTESPYLAIPFEQEESVMSQQFFYQERKGGKRGQGGGGEEGSKKFKSIMNINPDSCWFCLANPKVEKHMVLSIGNECYMALAKGGVTNDHVLIIPMNHFQSTISIASEILNEIDTYKKHLRDYFSKDGKVVVFFERNYKSAHLQLHAVPLPLAMQTRLQDCIVQCGRDNNLTLVELPERSLLEQIVIPPTSAFFVVELPGGKRLFTQVTRGFPLHFGRMMLLQKDLLDEADKEDWKQCQVPHDQEVLLCASFKKTFQPFDPYN